MINTNYFYSGYIWQSVTSSQLNTKLQSIVDNAVIASDLTH